MMKTNKVILLDLDNTVFETRSMDSRVFEPFFTALKQNLEPVFDQQVIHSIMNELWHSTWDAVISAYNIPRQPFMDSISVLENLEIHLNIAPYRDYEFIRQLPYPKFLVTTSLTSLQQAKIKALKIENDFERIIINDTFKEAKTKLDIFRELMLEFDLQPEHTYVIGDNADSEIKAGNSLSMVTVQILRDGVVKGNNARHYIKTFDELEHIFTKEIN